MSAGCANEVPADEDVVEDVGVISEALNQDVACGSSAGFPTWSWWSWTWVRFANRDTTGTKLIDATYQAGAGSPKSAVIGSASCEFEEPIERRECEISQQWGGFTLYVHNRGYWDVTSVI